MGEEVTDGADCIGTSCKASALMAQCATLAAERDALLNAAQLAVQEGYFPQGSGVLQVIRDAINAARKT